MTETLEPAGAIRDSKWASLTVLCLCEVAAMARLRAHPDSLRLAGRRR